jgi:hypothetical protein
VFLQKKSNKMDEKPDKSWTVVCLKAYLKENGGRVSGRKEDLLRMALLYAQDFESGFGANSTSATISEAQLTSERQIFENRTIIWQNVLEKKPEVPSLFDLMTINSFLTETTFHLGGEDDDDDEPIQSGTAKPVRKGRQMYKASKIQVCESGQHGDVVVFRCTMEASMKTNVFR